MKRGPYTIISTKDVYKNLWIEIKEDRVVRPDGQEGVFGVIDYGSGTSVVAIDEKQNIYLIKEYYYALERYGIQVPSGGVDKNETPTGAAKRELLEETGLIASKWIELGFVDPLTMILKSPAYLFLALGVSAHGKAEEGIEVVKLPLEEACQMVLDSKITHAPSCVAILKAKLYLKSLADLSS